MIEIAEYIAGAIGLSAGGVVGYLSRTLIENKLAINRIYENIRATEFSKAAATFRCAFTHEIRILEESTVDTDFIELFSAAYVRHRNAVIRFKPYLSKTERTEIEKAWQDHCYPKGLGGYERTMKSAKFIHYDHSQEVEIKNGNPLITKEHEISFEQAKNLSTSNIEKLISFAKIN